MKSFFKISPLKIIIVLGLFFLLPTFMNTICVDFVNAPGYCKNYFVSFWDFAIESRRTINQMIGQHFIPSLVANLIISYVIACVLVFAIKSFVRK